MNEDFDDALCSALRREAYRPEVRLDGNELRLRLEVDDRRRHELHRRRRVSFAGLAVLAVVALVVWSSAVGRPSVAPAASACPVSLPTTHGDWWVEIGGPHAYFNVEPGTLYATDNAWPIITRFDPDAAAGQDISMWAESVPSGQRVDAAFNSRMDPTNIYRFASPAPNLPGGWYLFEQGIPSAGCWRLVASVDGQIAGSAVIDVRLGAASAQPVASQIAPTPRLAAPSSTTTGPTNAPSSGARPTPLPAGPDVSLAGLTDPTHGWAVSDQRLQVTADGGSTWREVTPPGGLVTGLLGVDFVDAAHGWVAINEAFTSANDPSYGRLDIWRTTDGGRTWAKTQLPRARFAVFGEIMPAVQFDFLDSTRGFAFQSGNEAKGKNDSDLFWTADGGATWSADRPTGDGSQGNDGMIGFSSPTDGVIVNAIRDNGIVATHDGGRTWNDATLALPPGTPGAQLFYGQPVYLDGRSGFVVVDLQADSGSVYRVYRTSDAGSSWTQVSALPNGVSTVAFLDAQRWIGSDGVGMVVTLDGGETWLRSAAVGLPGAPALLQMASSQRGWALVSMSVCLDFKSNCSSRTGLYATVDGGSTWTQLVPG